MEKHYQYEVTKYVVEEFSLPCHGSLQCFSCNSFCHFVYLSTSSHTDSEPGEVTEEEDEDDGDEDQRRLLLPPPDVQLTTADGGYRHPRRPSTNDVHNI